MLEMRRLLPVLLMCLATAGCERTAERFSVASLDRRHGGPLVAGTPHGAGIDVVAIAETGDAALTADELGMVRLWPSLDGTRQAIPLAVMAPAQLALGTRDNELVATLVDRARSARVLRLGRDGVVHHRAQVAGEVAIRQVVAVGADVLVRRADETIERFDADGVMRGRIAARPGERIGAVTSRSGAALATIVSGEDSGAHAVRWIVLGDELNWGDEVALPGTIAGTSIALSPRRTYLAATVVRTQVVVGATQLVVYKLEDGKAKPFAMPGIDVPAGDVIGFTDDDHVAIAGSELKWWGPSNVDPWAAPADPPAPFGARQVGAGAIGDGVALFAYAAGLEIGTPDKNRYLGWRSLSFGASTIDGDAIAFGPNDGRFAWLDERLAETHSVELKALVHDEASPQPSVVVGVGDHHVAVVSQLGNQAIVDLVDVTNPTTRVELGRFFSVDRIEYEASLHQLAVAVPDRILRFAIDLDHLAATKLPAIPHQGSIYSLRLLDPARAGGAVAVVVGYRDGVGDRVETYRGTSRLKRTRDEALDGSVLAIDSTGAYYARNNEAPNVLTVRRDGHTIRTMPAPNVSGASAISHDRERLAVMNAQGIDMLDASGATRWHQSLIGTLTVAFTQDDRRLVVRATTGLVAYDVATGEQLASACGWAFGLHDTPVTGATYGQPSLCEDGPR
jgi:hypothetical protein